MTADARRRAALYTLEELHPGWQRTEPEAARKAWRRSHRIAAAGVAPDVLERACEALMASWPSSYAPPFPGDLAPYVKRVRRERASSGVPALTRGVRPLTAEEGHAAILRGNEGETDFHAERRRRHAR